MKGTMNPSKPKQSLSTQPYKGARDFYPEAKRLQKYMFGKLRHTVELFGYEEYDAPILEPLELYAAKSGEEIVNEQTYTFEDRGGRQVAIRPEMTPTVSRMVAGRRQELAYPLRWYSIPNLWRYERPQRGRLREHWQLNVDVFGVDDLAAEQELIQVGDRLLKDFGAKPSMYEIRVNHRQLIDAMLKDYMGFDAVQTHSLAKLIDRMAKMSAGDFEVQVDALCSPLQREQGAVAKLLALLAAKKIEQLPAELQSQPAAKQLHDLLESLPTVGVHNARFDLSLMRGFDYYTGIVFEVFDTNPDNNRSMFGGGRYDGLVGLFGVEPVPTVGFGMGDVTLQNFLESHNLLPELRPETDLYIGILSDKAYDPAQRVIQEMRDNGLRVAVDTSGRKIDKMLKAADKKGIRHALFIGERELESQMYELRDLASGQTESHGVARIISLLEDYRRR
jgi:histidyl-tRNA synthetase